MNKHNIVDLADFIKDRRKVKFEQSCLNILDGMNLKLLEMHAYAESFKTYVKNMVDDGYIKKSFANDLMQQVELMSAVACAQIASRGTR